MRKTLTAVLALVVFLHAFAPFARAGDPASGLLEPKDPTVRAQERAALIAFYEALGGVDWIQRDFWGSDKPVGDWHGVKTDAHSRVVLLKIYDNNLNGPVPQGLTDRLTVFDVSGNPEVSGNPSLEGTP